MRRMGRLYLASRDRDAALACASAPECTLTAVRFSVRGCGDRGHLNKSDPVLGSGNPAAARAWTTGDGPCPQQPLSLAPVLERALLSKDPGLRQRSGHQPSEGRPARWRNRGHQNKPMQSTPQNTPPEMNTTTFSDPTSQATARNRAGPKMLTANARMSDGGTSRAPRCRRW
jgi:hypothetical protein